MARPCGSCSSHTAVPPRCPCGAAQERFGKRGRWERALGSLGSALLPVPQLQVGGEAHGGDARRLLVYFLSFRRRKLAERTEASVQVSEFNVSCKGNIPGKLGRASAVRLRPHSPPRANSLRFAVSALDLWAERSFSPLALPHLC